MKTTVAIGLLIIGLAGCVSPNPPRIQAIDNALFQPVDMPLGWAFEWGVEDDMGCHERWSVFRQGDNQPFMQHIVYDCPNETAARTLVIAKSEPFAPGIRIQIGEGQQPASADEYEAWCDTPNLKTRRSPTELVTEKFCTTIARYGRLVSVMQVNRLTSDSRWPTEVDLLKWTIERNDARLHKAANTP